MSTKRPITDHILEQLQGSQDCAFEALVARYPEFTSSEIIYEEISRLSRAGNVIIIRDVGIFTIRQTAVVS